MYKILAYDSKKWNITVYYTVCKYQPYYVNLITEISSCFVHTNCSVWMYYCFSCLHCVNWYFYHVIPALFIISAHITALTIVTIPPALPVQPVQPALWNEAYFACPVCPPWILHRKLVLPALPGSTACFCYSECPGSVTCTTYAMCLVLTLLPMGGGRLAPLCFKGK